MSAAIQTKVQTLIRQISGIDDASVTLGNFRIIDTGRPPFFVILPGPFRNLNGTYNITMEVEWTIYVDVIVRFNDDSYTDLNSARELFFEQFNKLSSKQNLEVDSDAIRATITQGNELFYLYPRGGSDYPQYVGQRIVMTVVDWLRT